MPLARAVASDLTAESFDGGERDEANERFVASGGTRRRWMSAGQRRGRCMPTVRGRRGAVARCLATPSGTWTSDVPDRVAVHGERAGDVRGINDDREQQRARESGRRRNPAPGR